MGILKQGRAWRYIRKEALRIKQLQRFLNIDDSFGVLSAYSNLSKSQNKKRHGVLIREIQKRGYRFHPLQGEWEGTKEKSVLVPQMSWKDVSELGRMFGQDAVIWKGEDGVLGMYDFKNNTATLAVKPDANIAANMSPGNDLYSKSRGISFEFGFLWGQEMPWDSRTPFSRDEVQDLITQDRLTWREEVGSTTPTESDQLNQELHPPV